jgi:hypothetical protein
MIDAGAVVAAINYRHGTRYRLAGPMPSGESGTLLTSPGAERSVPFFATG